MQLTSPISSENLMSSQNLVNLVYNQQMLAVQVIVSLDLYHINSCMAIATVICVYELLGETKNFESFFVSDCELRQY